MKYETSFTIFPQDTNYNTPSCIFGGKMLAEMDNAAAMACRRALYRTDCTDCVTVKVETEFSRPAYVGDIVHISAGIISLGTKSLTVEVKAMREDRKNGSTAEMASGEFIFVARKEGVPHPHELKMPEPEDTSTWVFSRGSRIPSEIEGEENGHG